MRIVHPSALALVLAVGLPTSGAAQAARPAAPAPAPAHKVPREARVRSAVLPGWGHLYAGERARGVALAAASAASAAVVVADCAAHECVMAPPATAVGGVALLAYAATWAYGLADAGAAARRHNAAAQARARPGGAGAYVAPASGGVRVGLRVALGGRPAR